MTGALYGVLEDVYVLLQVSYHKNSGTIRIGPGKKQSVSQLFGCGI